MGTGLRSVKHCFEVLIFGLDGTDCVQASRAPVFFLGEEMVSLFLTFCDAVK